MSAGGEERGRSLARDQGGATMVMGIFMAVLLVAMIYYVAGIGETIMYKETMQDAADSGAFAAAVMHARGMNVIALLNMVMAAVLAVLVALKIIHALGVMAVVVSTGICAAGCRPPEAAWGCWACPLIPVAVEYEETVASVIEEVEPQIHRIVDIASEVQVVIRDGMPYAAQAKVIQTGTDTYDPPTEFGFMTPVDESLATEDDDSTYLCRKAGEQAAPLVPGPVTGSIVTTFVPGWRGAIGGLADTFSSYFCGESADKAQRVVDAELGEERFQIRAFMKGDPSFDWSRRGVAIATWGREDGSGGSGYDALEKLTQFSFAQAEYYYDDGDYGSDVDRKEWLWHMNWRARLRRFTLPGGVDPSSACAVAGGSCAGLAGLPDISEAVVH